MFGSSSAEARSPTNDAPPQRLGKYHLLRRLARGGMGDVHLAKLSGELGFEKLLVVKTIRAELASDPRFVELFAREAKTAVSLSHPNITPIYELGRADDGTLYTAMGWVDGPSLAQWIERRRNQGVGGFELGAALLILRELLDALAHAHSREQGRTPVVHRDVTTRNVLVERSGRVQLVDFGIAKPVEPLGTIGELGGVMGSVGYMAPEQARGEAVDPRADVFAAGCVLYELLTLEQAFPREGIWMAPDLSAIHPRVQALLERALALDPAQRFADAREFLRATLPVLAELAPGFASPDLAAALREQFSTRGWTNPEILRPAGATPSTRATPVHRTVAFAIRELGHAPEHEPPASPTPATLTDPTRDEPDPTPLPLPARHRSESSRWWLAGLLMLAIVIAIAIVLALRDDASEAGPREPQPPAAGPTLDPVDAPAEPVREPSLELPPQSPPTPPPPDQVAPYAITVRPASAQLWFAGKPLPGPPFELPADAQGTLDVRAAGHHDRQIELDPTGPRALQIELEALGIGQLTVLAPTVAWAEVWVDGEKLGNTPLSDRAIAEGTHKLEVRCTAEVCDDERVLLRKSLRIRADRTTKVTAAAVP